MRTRRTLTALVVAGALAVAACGGDDASDSPPTDGDGGAETTDGPSFPGGTTEPANGDDGTSPGTDVDEPTAEIDRDATLRVSYSVGPSSFDPAESSSSIDSPSLFLTYDRVVHLDQNAEVVPGLAESWEFNGDGTELTLNVREGMTFHDGEPVDAEAIAVNLMRNKEGAAAGDLNVMESAEAVDELTVVVAFNGPAGAFPAVLGDRAGVIASPAAFGEGLDLQPVGAGMYRVVEHQRDARIVYERFEDYWDPDAAAAARVEFSIIPDNVAALNALRGDQLDWALILPTQVEDARSAGFEVSQGLTLNVHHIQLNRTRQYLDDVDVRRAISMAIDRDGMVEGILQGTGVSSSQPFPRGYWGHDPDIEVPAYDPDAARALLQEAGVPEGHRLELLVPNTNVYPQLGQVVKENLDNIGFEVEIRLIDGVQAAPIFYGQEDGDMLVAVFGGRVDPAQHFGALYTASAVSNPGSDTWPALDEVLPDVLAAGEQADREAAVHAASRVVSDDALNIVLHHPQANFAYSSRVVGVDLWLIGRPEFRGMGIAAS